MVTTKSRGYTVSSLVHAFTLHTCQTGLNWTKVQSVISYKFCPCSAIATTKRVSDTKRNSSVVTCMRPCDLAPGVIIPPNTGRGIESQAPQCQGNVRTLKRCGHLIRLQLVYPIGVEHQSVNSVIDSEKVPASFEMAETRWPGVQRYTWIVFG